MNNPFIASDGTKRWYNDTYYLHRDDGPAVEMVNGYKAWYINNKLHRTDGPARDWGNGRIEYWINDKRHREDGPACEYVDGRKEYWINYKLYDSLEEGLMDQALE